MTPTITERLLRTREWGHPLGTTHVNPDGPDAARTIERLCSTLDEICREFAQGHPLIANGRSVLNEVRGNDPR